MPAWLHVEVTPPDAEGVRALRARYLTSRGSDIQSCREFGKCAQIVEAITMHFVQGGDGLIAIEDRIVRSGSPHVIDRAATDPFLVAPLLGFIVDGARPVEDEDGLTFVTPGGGALKFVPTTLGTVLEAVAIPDLFEISAFDAYSCLVGPVAAIHASEPTKGEGRFLDALTYLHRIDDAEDESARLLDLAAPASAQITSDTARAARLSAALSMPLSATVDVLRDDPDAPDARLFAERAEWVASVTKSASADGDAIAREALADPEGFVALARYAARGTQLAAGADLGAALCEDVTLQSVR